MVKFLLSSGADPNIKDKTGRNALEIAQHLGRNEVVKILQEFVKDKPFKFLINLKEVEDPVWPDDLDDLDDNHFTFKPAENVSQPFSFGTAFIPKEEAKFEDLNQKVIQANISFKLVEISFSDDSFQCTNGKVYVHRLIYLLCPALRQQYGTLNYAMVRY
jgi:hypothetical protein